MPGNIKVLDCTLRDGGYVIDWMFGRERILSIIEALSLSGIDYIECGFLKEEAQNPDKTFFRTISDFSKFALPGQSYTLMVNYGEYGINNFEQCLIPDIKIRVAFKRHCRKDALLYIEKLTELGWDVFANPMSTNTYSRDELSELINDINKIKPRGLSIVDTLGNMREDDVLDTFKFIDKYLENSIAVGFHSHNSLKLSFSDTKSLLQAGIAREIIIDCSIRGMGRGAGNLSTEIITQYLNGNYKTKYNTALISEIFNKHLKQIFERTPWGYTESYHAAALHGCHPNYAGFLIDLKLSAAEIERVLSQIPEDKKTSFDRDLIYEITTHWRER